MLSLLAEATRTTSLANVTEEHVNLALTGMLVVFCALGFISVFIALLPRLLELVEGVFPAPEEHASVAANGAGAPVTTVDDAPRIAAIAVALAHERARGAQGGR